MGYRKIDQGRWNIYKYKNFFFIDIYNREEIQSSFYSVSQSSNQGLLGSTFLFPDFFHTSYTKIDSVVFESKEYLTAKERKQSKELLIGEWQARNEFYRQDTLFDRELLTNIFFKLILTARDYSIKYGATGTTKTYKRELHGTWDISKTGEYLEIKYINEFRGKKYKVTDYIAIDKLTHDNLNISWELRSVTDEYFTISGLKILMEKN